jgi:hypothetical protein
MLLLPSSVAMEAPAACGAMSCSSHNDCPRRSWWSIHCVTRGAASREISYCCISNNQLSNHNLLHTLLSIMHHHIKWDHVTAATQDSWFPQIAKHEIHAYQQSKWSASLPSSGFHYAPLDIKATCSKALVLPRWSWFDWGCEKLILVLKYHH